MPTHSFTVAKTYDLAPQSKVVSQPTQDFRRTVRNIGGIPVEISGVAFAFGAGHPLSPGESFTFDSDGRTTSAIHAASPRAGGAVSVISY